MATKATTPTNPFAALPLADLTELATQATQQWLSSMKQGQDLALGAVKSLADVAKTMPMPDLGVSLPTAAPALGDAVNLAFDFANEALAAQREFATQVAELFKPATA